MSASVVDLQHFQGVHDGCSPVYCSVVRGDASDVRGVENRVGSSANESNGQPSWRGLPMDGGPPLYSCGEFCGCEACVMTARLEYGTEEKLGLYDEDKEKEYLRFLEQLARYHRREAEELQRKGTSSLLRRESLFEKENNDYKVAPGNVVLAQTVENGASMIRKRQEVTEKEWKVLGLTICRKREYLKVRDSFGCCS